MKLRSIFFKSIHLLLLFCLFLGSGIFHAQAKEKINLVRGNFGLPGIIDLPTGYQFPDGELVVTQQLHNSLARSAISFQALPIVGFSFRYSGHGIGGREAYGRINHDRSFDAHIKLTDENKFWPAISIGLRDFIGTGWYSSEYIVGTKTIGNLELTTGLGFGRLAGRNRLENPLKVFSPKFKTRGNENAGVGGTLGDINWFTGHTALFYGANYELGNKIIISAEYTPDLMIKESGYLDIKSPWNFGLHYQTNKYSSLSVQYLHGSQISLSASLYLNPAKPPFKGGKELAPVPMRLRGIDVSGPTKSDEKIIRKVLAADKFEIHHLSIEGNVVRIDVTNTKFRSIAQAIGRVASNLQRFTSNDIKFANVSFVNRGLTVASYRIDLEQITELQYNPLSDPTKQTSITPINLGSTSEYRNSKQFSWGVGPYVTHRLFNPDLPLSAETGLEIQGAYHISNGLKISGSLRKSVFTNLTDNKRRSNSVLPRVHSDWPLYDFAGQNGHIHDLTLSYVKNIAPGVYGKLHAGLLEPFFAGVGGEVLFKPANMPIALGIDIHRVRKRDYDMLFDLKNYETSVGHVSVYYDVGGMFDFEINAGRYLARDWGATATIARKFGSGWEVGGYATLTDVPFKTFGEGSFDKAIYVSIPIDWLVSTPNKAKRRLTLRPITRDGGANLATARALHRQIEEFQSANFKREYGRLWK